MTGSERDGRNGRDRREGSGRGGESDDGSNWPNRNTLWAEVFVGELAKGGVSAVCIAPGSRSTPLTVAFADHPDIEVFSHLDERSAAFFALGRAKRTGEVTPVLSTSGTATANFHPAVIEANQARVPLLVLTADRPPELRDSGANQTVDQEKLYGSAVRFYRDLPEPAADGRKLRSLRVDAGRALAASTGTPPGPVHLNFPFRKPLEPIAVSGDVPDGFEDDEPLAATGRDGPFVRTESGRPELDDQSVERVHEALGVERGLVVAGPSTTLDPAAVAALASATGFPVLADPLSGLRYGSHLADLDVPVCGGYDSYLDARAVDNWPAPEVALRVGASPTSKVLRNYLRDAVRESGTRQFVVDPAGEWREATFTASDLVIADPNRLALELAERAGRTDSSASDTWRERFRTAEANYWNAVETAHDDQFFEGTVPGDVIANAPDPATVFVSNSMTVRDADRFGRPRDAALTVLGNRGASGIDGIVSTGLGAGSATDDPLVCVLGDLAYYHDMNGLLALSRCDADATVVLINNDGGGIFRMLPIAEFDPPFTEQFETPHGLDFAPTAELYGFEFVRADDRAAFRDAYQASLGSTGTQVIEVAFDAGTSHAFRETVHGRACDAIDE
ncbi:2-succinyl-5-enolpyruvyl-6-hydroxy-3-cyclohexene-1-carboxylic-acid synthase [Halococcus agarilyticus]|uniref:2-succinyl-5-enolpyruvyl-6-hydroxy-3- cyclohexene-1-carboxylic-acid synthase n=1 Tax=Halococcus agarilyticus TaxID=1232219 RepID=UPI0009ACD524|nr:2-succinyl-5-enolpyruvyl-6-hydroxy-3-cyclohexene-1-carboxylic-acid synthase [Halococcus agarilyticus]